MMDTDRVERLAAQPLDAEPGREPFGGELPADEEGAALIGGHVARRLPRRVVGQILALLQVPVQPFEVLVDIPDLVPARPSRHLCLLSDSSAVGRRRDRSLAPAPG